MFSRLACFVGLVCTAWLCPAVALAEPLQSQIVIDHDLRVFTVMAALNVAGFDVELGSQYHPARAEIRKVASGLDPDLAQRLKEFYATHKAGLGDEDQLAKYISLAVVLGDPPSFKAPTREEALPDEVRPIVGFAPMLAEFYQKAGVARLWASVSAAYDAEMDRMGPPIRDAISKADSYLRVATGGRGLRSMKISVELGAPQNSVNVRSDGEEYYVVVGYSNTPKVEEIRHAYLHLRLNDYAVLAASKVEKRATLMALLSGVEGIGREYAVNFESLFTESLVRAVELRIDRVSGPRAEQSLRTNYRSGLLLAPYFHEALTAYEASDDSLRDHISIMASAVDVAKEQLRFERTFNSIPVPEREPVRAEVPTAPVVDPVLELLKAAQAVFDKDKERAREAFETVLREFDSNNGRALYGLGLIEMDRIDADRRHVDEALKYFERTIASPSADRSMKTWSHIYAGHILDFKCDRPAALEHYRKVIESGDNTRDAQRIANRDLLQPFGGECPQ